VSSVAEDRLASLDQRIDSGKLHHGLLFRGNDLRFLEQSVSQLYRKILRMEGDEIDHPDLFHLRPTGKARIITVEKTRALMSNLYRSGNQSKYKVAIVHETDRMRKEAANAFLKTLEEPPHGTYLFLLTTRPYSILPTIRSRSLLVRLDKDSNHEDTPELAEWLIKYNAWICLLLDREKLKQDRVSPVFMAYGLIESLVSLIKSTADMMAKEAVVNLSQDLDEKEKDAYESGLRRGIRTNMLKQISDHTRNFVTSDQQAVHNLGRNGQKLAKVVMKLEKICGLLEVNLKEDTALEDFLLSSLRIWSAK
jgi:DNA polymerase-3 subunit delta'